MYPSEVCKVSFKQVKDENKRAQWPAYKTHLLVAGRNWQGEGKMEGTENMMVKV